MNSAVRDYLASIGKKGGAVASEAQKAAARENGKKGGRPKMTRDESRAHGKEKSAAKRQRNRNQVASQSHVLGYSAAAHSINAVQGGLPTLGKKR